MVSFWLHFILELSRIFLDFFFCPTCVRNSICGLPDKNKCELPLYARMLDIIRLRYFTLYTFYYASYYRVTFMVTRIVKEFLQNIEEDSYVSDILRMMFNQLKGNSYNTQCCTVSS